MNMSLEGIIETLLFFFSFFLFLGGGGGGGMHPTLACLDPVVRGGGGGGYFFAAENFLNNFAWGPLDAWNKSCVLYILLMFQDRVHWFLDGRYNCNDLFCYNPIFVVLHYQVPYNGVCCSNFL